jgi:hypothetical protein
VKDLEDDNETKNKEIDKLKQKIDEVEHERFRMDRQL